MASMTQMTVNVTGWMYEMIIEFHKLLGSDEQRLGDLPTNQFADDSLEAVAQSLARESRYMYQQYEAVGFTDKRLLRAHLMLEELGESLQGLSERDEVKTLDGLADLAYTVIGTGVQHDLPVEHAFTEVHRSNMTKRPTTGSNNRCLDKGEGWSPPNIQQVIEFWRTRV